MTKYIYDKRHHMITCNRGAVLYDDLEGISPQAAKRLAELHTLNQSLNWEASTPQEKGAWDILIDEGLLND